MMTSNRKDVDASGRSYKERREYVRQAKAILKLNPTHLEAKALYHGNACDVCIDSVASVDYSECCPEGRAIFLALDKTLNREVA